ncbi:MAG: hypothetical protein KIT34_02380 [Cyanobacteria bacterium TGS_CYA1]|nr:hypothetical protein [Cyanobacteria bacterium TGS_CYA1]
MVIDKNKRLVKLGAEALATALLDLANYNSDAEAVVERLLASPKDNAKTFKKRLSSFKRRRSFISWGESGAYARDLASMLKALEASESDPKAGVQSVAEFFEADEQIFAQCDDSNGSVGDVFRFEAAELFVSYGSRCDDKDWLLELVLTINEKDNYGVRDVLFQKMSQFLPESIIRQAIDRLWILASSQTDKYKGRHWLFAIEELSKQIKDPQLLEKVCRAQSDGELPIASIIDIAKLYFQCDELASALLWVEKIPLNKTYMECERDDLLIAIYQKQGNSKKLIEIAWRVFRRDRNVDSLEVLLSAVGREKRSSIVEEEAKSILKAKEFDSGDAGFLIETGRIDDAETYIIEHSKQLNGDFYSSLLEIAKAMLKHDRLVAASVIYRALLDSILARAKSMYYHHGIAYLKKLDSLAQKIQNWKSVDSHSQYFATLQQKHKLKSSFWSQFNPQAVPPKARDKVKPARSN